MIRKTILLIVAMFSLLLFTACAAATPQAAPAAETAPTEAPAEAPAPTEAATEAPAPTEAPAAEEVPTVEPTEEATEEVAEATTYTVDTGASTLEWYGERPVGGSENGIVQIAEGRLSFTGNELVDGLMVIDMTTIEPTSKTGDMLSRLAGHLMSDDFFAVETYPTSTLVIKSAEPTDVENQYAVTADLTIKETTNEIQFLTDVVAGDGTLAATAEIILDRSLYNVQYGSGSFFDNLGDDLISDEMRMTVSLVATR